MKKLLFTFLLFSSFFSNGMEEEFTSRFCHDLARSLADASGLSGVAWEEKYAEEYHWCENNDWDPQQ